MNELQTHFGRPVKGLVDFSGSDGAWPTLARRFRYGAGRDDENGLRMQADLVRVALELLGE